MLFLNFCAKLRLLFPYAMRNAITRKSYLTIFSRLSRNNGNSKEDETIGESVVVYLICTAADSRFCVESYFSASQSIEHGNQADGVPCRTMLEFHRTKPADRREGRQAAMNSTLLSQTKLAR